MSEIPAEAVNAAALAIHKMACPGDGIDGCLADNTCEEKPFSWEIGAARAALEALGPFIGGAIEVSVAAERERLSAVMSPEQFRKLADWFDTDDEFKEAMFPETWSPGDRKDDVQQDLRKFADLLGGAS
jgi:hypothetical protein